MIEEIKKSLSDPQRLEQLYRENKLKFRKAFDQVYPEISSDITARVWHERLNYESKDVMWGTKSEWLILAGLSLLAGLIAVIPQYAGWDEEFYYTRNIGFIFLPAMILYFAWKHSVPAKKLSALMAVVAVSSVYINLLPADKTSDTLLLACIHLPLMIWALLGFTFTGDEFRLPGRRIDYLRFNGELVVLTAVIFIAGAVLSGVTIGLFSLINLKIEEFYFTKIALWGVGAAPVIATHIVRTNPQLVRNVSPVIAKIFTPLVLVMLVVYLSAMGITGKDPYNDREFLLIFNVLLVGVMAIIFFSVAESSNGSGSRLSGVMLLLLSLVTVVVNLIALSAIIFRISSWGITPNRLAVLGSNVLILINLVMVAWQLFKSLKPESGNGAVEISIARWLPVYAIWTVLVTFGFPLIFSFR